MKKLLSTKVYKAWGKNEIEKSGKEKIRLGIWNYPK